MNDKIKVPGILKGKRIAVICGGVSQERNISLKSGGAVYEAIKSVGLKAEKIDAKRNLVKKLSGGRYDLAFIALHGRMGEDGTVQGLLELLGIPYTGSGVMASSIAIDKPVTKKVLAFHGINTPGFEVYEKGSRKNPGIRFPLVVKPAREGSSIGVSIVKNMPGFRLALNRALKYDHRVLVESYIKGRELSVGVIDSEPLPVIEIIPASTRKFYDLDAKYAKGGSVHVVPAGISKKQYELAQELAVKTHKAIGCSGATRTDMILARTGKIFVLEINTIPGMTKTSLIPDAAAAVGVSFAEVVLKILVSALQK